MSTQSKEKPGWAFLLMGGATSLFMAVGVFILPIAFVGLDLYLGPQFMTGYIDDTGMYSGAIATTISWSFSIATTGFQYLLFLTVRGINWKSATFEEWLVIIFGFIVAFMDSGIDLAGFTSLTYGSEQGIQVIPDNPGIGYTILAPIVVAMCFLQEIILRPIYDRPKGKIKAPFDWPAIGAFVAAFKAASFLYGQFCQLARAFAIAGVLVLDVFLTYFFFKSTLGTEMNLPVALEAIAWAIAIGLTVGQFVLYYVSKEKAKASEGMKPKLKERFSTLAIVGFGFTTLDTLIDLSALTIMMYGPEQTGGFWFVLLPNVMSLAFLFLAGSIVLMCSRYESLMVAAFKHGFAKTVKGI